MDDCNVKLANGYVTSLSSLKSERVLIDHEDLSSLVGQLMQYIEATYSDIEQRNAHKGIVKNICRDWLNDYYKWQKGWSVMFNVNPNESDESSASMPSYIKYVIGELSPLASVR